MTHFEIDYHVEQRPVLTDNEIDHFGWLIEKQLFEDKRADINVSSDLLEQALKKRSWYQAVGAVASAATKMFNNSEDIDPEASRILFEHRWELYENS